MVCKFGNILVINLIIKETYAQKTDQGVVNLKLINNM